MARPHAKRDHYIFGRARKFHLLVTNLRDTTTPPATTVQIVHERPTVVTWSAASNIQYELSKNLMTFDATPNKGPDYPKIAEIVLKDLEAADIGLEKATQVAHEIAASLGKIIIMFGPGDGIVTITVSNDGMADATPVQYTSTYSD